MKNKIYLGEAFGLIAKTMPFIWIRLGSYLILGLALGIVFAVAGGLAWLLAKLWAPLGFIVFILAFGGAWGIVQWAGRYYFYMLKAAHTAVMTEFISTGKGPKGSQVDNGRQQVMSRFNDTSNMFGVDVLVDGVVKAFTRTLTNITSILPIPGMDSLGNLIQRVARMSTTYIDEAILSRAYKMREQNVWKVAHDGVILYAQAWQPILLNAVVLALIGFVEFLALLIILGIPAVAIGLAMPALRVALGIGVIVAAWMIKLAVSDAFSLAATLIAYHRATEGMEPNEEWRVKLQNSSEQFRDLRRKALENMPRGARTAAPAAPPPDSSDNPDASAGEVN
jgi:hypothetical protein